MFFGERNGIRAVYSFVNMAKSSSGNPKEVSQALLGGFSPMRMLKCIPDYMDTAISGVLMCKVKQI